MGDDREISGILFGFGDFGRIDHEAAAGAEIDFGPGFDEMQNRAVTTAREQKEEVVVNGPMDMEDQCVIVMPQGSFYCPIRQMCEGMHLDPPEAIALSMQALGGPLGKPIAVLALVETVYRVKQQGERRPERGEISELWHAGTDINIKEALTVVVATPHRVAVEFMPYHYGEGSVVWDEGSRRDLLSEEGWPDIVADDGTGVVEAIRSGFVSEKGGPDGTE